MASAVVVNSDVAGDYFSVAFSKPILSNASAKNFDFDLCPKVSPTLLRSRPRKVPQGLTNKTLFKYLSAFRLLHAPQRGQHHQCGCDSGNPWSPHSPALRLCIGATWLAGVAAHAPGQVNICGARRQSYTRQSQQTRAPNRRRAALRSLPTERRAACGECRNMRRPMRWPSAGPTLGAASRCGAVPDSESPCVTPQPSRSPIDVAQHSATRSPMDVFVPAELPLPSAGALPEDAIGVNATQP